MSIAPELGREPDLSVEQGLFDAVEQILVRDGPFLIESEGRMIQKWNARHGKVMLSDVVLSNPLSEGGFQVLAANIEVGYPRMESAISIHRKDPQITGHDYDNDFVAHDVLAGLRRYIDQHPHSKCIRFID